MKLEIRMRSDEVRVEVEDFALDDENFSHLGRALAPVVAKITVGTFPVVNGLLFHINDVIPTGPVVHAFHSTRTLTQRQSGESGRV